MYQLTTTTEQTLAPGQSVVFNQVLYRTGCKVSHRANSSIVTLEPICGVYDVRVHGNVSGTAAGTTQLQIMREGEGLPETIMYAQIATPDEFENVSAETLIGVCGRCCQSIAVTNTSATETVIVAAGANLIVC